MDHNTVNEVVQSLPFSAATWFVIVIIIFIFWLFAYDSKRTCSRALKWEDLILDSDTNRVTPFKVGYLIGVVVSTWIVISLTDSHGISYDIFGLYLSYLLGGAGWSEFINRRNGGSSSSSSTKYNSDSDENAQSYRRSGGRGDGPPPRQ